MTHGTLVDSNVLLDVLTEDPTWLVWSTEALAVAADTGPLFINPIIYAEVSVRFAMVEELEDALPPQEYRRLPLSWEAAFLAGKAFVQYRRHGGARTSTLPDFFIGAHALSKTSPSSHAMQPGIGLTSRRCGSPPRMPEQVTRRACRALRAAAPETRPHVWCHGGRSFHSTGVVRPLCQSRRRML